MEQTHSIEKISHDYRQGLISGEQFAALFKAITDERAAILAGMVPEKLPEQSQELR
jgi:hypothetical protein